MDKVDIQRANLSLSEIQNKLVEAENIAHTHNDLKTALSVTNLCVASLVNLLRASGKHDGH